MRINLRPREDAFYDYFTRAAVNVLEASKILLELALDEPDYQSISDRLVEYEHANDDITHDMLRKLNSSFVTPFDRSDIYRLGSTLDDVMDHMEAAGNLVQLYGLSSLPKVPREMRTLVDVIAQCAE